MQIDYPEMQPGQILRLPEVKKLTGLSRSTIYARMREKRFPERIDLGGRAVGWRAESIFSWINSCATKSSGKQRS